MIERLLPGQLWLGKTRIQYSAAQLELEACIYCGSAQRPLHPGPTLPITDGVVRDTVLCTGCLEADQ
jgi:hypothetical protein